MANEFLLLESTDYLIVEGTDRLIIYETPDPNPPVITPVIATDTWMTDSTLLAELEPIDTVSIDVPIKQWRPGASPHRV